MARRHSSMTLYELARFRGRLISKNMIRIPVDDELYRFIWIRHAPKSRTNQAYLGIGLERLDREAWGVLATCISSAFESQRDAKISLPIVKHATERLNCGFPALPRGSLDIYEILKQVEQTPLEQCLVEMSLQSFVTHLERKWKPLEWLDVHPPALFSLYTLIQRDSSSGKLAPCRFHGLHEDTLQRVNRALLNCPELTYLDIENFIMENVDRIH